jgi:hypothetical protein
MAQRISAWTLIQLGQRFQFLSNPQVSHAVGYSEEIARFLQLLSECDLVDASNAASSLANWNIPYDARTGILSPASIAHFQAMMAPVSHSLVAEACRRNLIFIKPGAVSQQLRDLPSRLTLNDTQKQLLDETTLCLEAGANRAAVVMGWNLAYDVIRQWVYDNHLADFNVALAKNVDKKTGNPVYKPIVDYGDFFSGKPGEHTVIDTWFDANIKIGGRLRDNLQQHLRRRNDYAHRSFTTPTSEQAAAYIQEMVDIISCPPFV